MHHLMDADLSVSEVARLANITRKPRRVCRDCKPRLFGYYAMKMRQGPRVVKNACNPVYGHA